MRDGCSRMPGCVRLPPPGRRALPQRHGKRSRLSWRAVGLWSPLTNEEGITLKFHWKRPAFLSVAVCAAAVAAATAYGSPAKTQATELTALIGSSGPAETNAVQVATGAWTKKTGIKVNVIVASDLGQQLAQGFASGNPPDIFYLGNDQVATYAKAGSLAPLDKLKNVRSFYPSLRAAFTYKGHLYAAPKDFSTLALVLNTASWKKAGLTAKSYPK